MAQEVYDYVVRDIVSAQAIGGSGIVVTVTGVQESPLRLYLSVSGVGSLLAKLRAAADHPADGPVFGARIPIESPQPQ